MTHSLENSKNLRLCLLWKLTNIAAKTLFLGWIMWKCNDAKICYSVEPRIPMLLTGIKDVGKVWFIYLHKTCPFLGKYLCLYRSCCYFAVSKKCCFGRFRDMKINGIRSQDSVFESFLINNVRWNIVASFLWVLKIFIELLKSIFLILYFIFNTTIKLGIRYLEEKDFSFQTKLKVWNRNYEMT